jgi:hypothetical protein
MQQSGDGFVQRLRKTRQSGHGTGGLLWRAKKIKEFHQ